MATPDVNRAVVDTNVLLAATDEARPDHEAAQRVLNDWSASGVVLYSTGQVLREYLAVATRPASANGLGLPRQDAIANVRALRSRMHLLVEDLKVHERLLRLLEEFECGGKQIHDASIVATMLVHGIEAIVTINVNDFTRFGQQLRVVDLRTR